MFWKMVILVLCVVFAGPLRADDSYVFGVLPQRNTLLLAEYWNPILEYVQRKSGVQLQFRTTRTSVESNQAVARGEYDFVYSNHIFEPNLMPVGYRVILRPRAEALKSQIVVGESSPIHSLRDLENQTVGFVSRSSFAGYAVPLDELMRLGISVTPAFGDNQEGTMSQLKLGKVVAAAVNSEIMRSYATRENFRYRVIWESRPYQNMPIAVHPRIAARVADSVGKAFAEMIHDPEGEMVLRRAAELIKQSPPLGFYPGTQADYQAYIDFFKTTRVKDMQ